MDYSAEKCCHPNNPHLNTNNICNDYPIMQYNYPPFPPQPFWISDNWYTRQSDICTTRVNQAISQYNENIYWKCEGTNFYLCEQNPRWIMLWHNQGKIVGKCGYEPECSGNEFKCEGNILFTCTPDSTWREIGLSPPNIAPDGSFCSEPECQTNDDCEEGFKCENNVCVEIPTHPPTPINWDLIIGISVTIVLLISVIFLVVIFRRR